MAAIARHNLPLFKLMSTTCLSQDITNQLPNIYLQRPSQFNGYLRRVIASWVAENAVSIEYLVPQSVQLPLQFVNTHNMKKDVNQSSDEDQNPCNEYPAMDIHSNDFPVCEDRGHQTPMNQVPDYVNDQDKPDDEGKRELNEVNDVDASGIENNVCVDGGHCQVNPAKNIHCNVSVDKDRGQKIPTNGVPDYVNCQEKPDDKVSEESNEEDDVKVSVVEDNTLFNDGHCQVNPAKVIHSSVPVNKDRGHQIPANQDSGSNKQDSDVTVNKNMSDDSISSREASEENCSVPGKNKKHQCKLCLLVFSRNASLKRHMKRQHPDEKVEYSGTCHCHHCDFKCHKISDLRQHLGDKHGVVFTTTTVYLDNIAAFEQWKAKVEEEERCSFIKTTGMKGPVQYYQCNRGGLYKPKGTAKRHLKSQGSCKIQHNCTATLKAATNEDGKIAVDLCLTRLRPPARTPKYMVAKTEKRRNGSITTARSFQGYLGTLERMGCKGRHLNAITSPT